MTTEDGILAAETLQNMVADPAYSTEPSHTADITAYPDGQIPFVDKHLKYLIQNRNVNLEHYFSNLRLMTRLR